MNNKCSTTEKFMVRYRTFTMLVLFWLALFLVGGEPSQEIQKAKPASEARPAPVLKADDNAKTVIGKAVKAHGGKKAFSRWNCGYLKYKTKGGFVPAQFGEVTLEDTFQLPGHFKRITRMDAGGKELVMFFVINQGKGWTKQGDGPAKPIDNDFTKKAEHPFAGFCNLAPLTEADVRLTKLGEVKIGDRPAIGVRVQSDKLGEVDFYFSSQTGLLLKSRKSLPGADADKPAIMESFLDDYKDVQGGKVPMRIKGARDGKAILDMTLIEVKFADKFEDSTFAKP
jgi:hypothetical protein